MSGHVKLKYSPLKYSSVDLKSFSICLSSDTFVLTFLWILFLCPSRAAMRFVVTLAVKCHVFLKMLKEFEVSEKQVKSDCSSKRVCAVQPCPVLLECESESVQELLCGQDFAVQCTGFLSSWLMIVNIKAQCNLTGCSKVETKSSQVTYCVLCLTAMN